MIMILSKTSILLLAALLLVLVIIFTQDRENFSFGDLFKKVKNVGKNVGEKVVNVGKNVGEKVVDVSKSSWGTVSDFGKKIGNKIGDIIPGSGGGAKIEVKGKIFDKDFVPIYMYRERASNGTWTCPKNTVDYGTNDDKQCLASEIGPRIYRDLAASTGNWGWKCPEGTVPNPGANEWNQQCVRGFSQRRWVNGAWRCYNGDEDTGISWENADWWAAQRQCKKSEYPSVTTRMWDGKGWSCPPGTTDTGLDWRDGADGFKQCKINPGG